MALVKRYHGALNGYDEKVVKALFAPGAIYVSPGVNGRIEGRDAIIAAFNIYFADHPDQQAVDEALDIISPHQLRARWRLEATRRSTGQRITRRGVETITFDQAGLIAHVLVEDLVSQS